MTSVPRRAVAALLPFLAVACSSGATTSTTGSSEQFFATASSFDGFCNWSQAPALAAGDAGDGLHGLGPLTVYWNQAPPHGATEFPEGTIIVKANQASDPTQRVIFAMVKRGGGYNSGLPGWEWYSLEETSSACDVAILWHNDVPPSTETYAGQTLGDCNGCHAQAGNDGVYDTALQLINF